MPLKRPCKSSRGRKPVSEAKYIKEAERKIQEWEAILEANRGVWSQKKYTELYNRKTALECRLRAKREVRRCKKARAKFTVKYDILCTALKRIPMECRERLANKIHDELR